MKNIIKICFLFYGAICGFNGLVLDTSAESAVGIHGGQILQSDGHIYELVNDVPHHKVHIYTPARNAGTDLPSSLVVKIKKNDTVVDRLHFTLNQNAEPNSPSYEAKLPTTVLVSGGITFELDF